MVPWVPRDIRVVQSPRLVAPLPMLPAAVVIGSGEELLIAVCLVILCFVLASARFVGARVGGPRARLDGRASVLRNRLARLGRIHSVVGGGSNS